MSGFKQWYKKNGRQDWQPSVIDIEWSGREDSNLRPLGPKPSALPGCATPRGTASRCALHSREENPMGQAPGDFRLPIANAE